MGQTAEKHSFAGVHVVNLSSHLSENSETRADNWNSFLTEFKKQVDSARSSGAANSEMRSILSRFPKFDLKEDKLVLSNDTSSIVISANAILHGSTGKNAPSAEDEFRPQDIAFLASLNPLMRREGIITTGTPRQIERLNSMLDIQNTLSPAEAVVPVALFAKTTPVSPGPSVVPKIAEQAERISDEPAAPRQSLFSNIASGIRKTGAALLAPFGIFGNNPSKQAISHAEPTDRTDNRRGVVKTLGGGIVALAATISATPANGGFFEELFGIKPEPQHAVSGQMAVQRGRRSNRPHKVQLQGAGEAQPVAANAGSNRVQMAHNKYQPEITQQDQPQSHSFFGSLASGNLHLVNQNTGRNPMDLDFNSIGSRSCSNQFNSFACDWRTGQSVDMDPNLLGFVRDITAGLRARGYRADQCNLISGYRSRATNEFLRATKGGQAKDSQHCYGRALDIRFPGVPMSVLYDVADSVVGSRGGVGIYGGFVHIDARGYKARWGAKATKGVSRRKLFQKVLGVGV